MEKSKVEAPPGRLDIREAKGANALNGGKNISQRWKIICKWQKFVGRTTHPQKYHGEAWNET